MERDLGNHYLFQRGFDPAELDAISALWDPDAAEDAIVHTRPDHSYRKTRLRWLGPTPQTRWIYERVWALAQQANAELWGFALDGPSEHIQLGEYRDGGHYDWHMDCRVGHSARRKLSVTVQLSDPGAYSGGDLELMTSRRPRRAPRDQGCVIVFPSFQLHRVTPVTAGVRRSMVCWLTGPPLR